jgi:hypothetical protein
VDDDVAMAGAMDGAEAVVGAGRVTLVAVQ